MFRKVSSETRSSQKAHRKDLISNGEFLKMVYFHISAIYVIS